MIDLKLVKNYMLDENLRHGLNYLTTRVFGFDFEGWVTKGYFEGDYIPYSYEESGKIIANASANIMNFNYGSEKRNYIQIGTVMTDEAYRKNGLARSLINEIINDYKDKCDGIYLFANLEALGFYDKVGFKQVKESRYSLKENCMSILAGEEKSLIKVEKEDESLVKKYFDFVRNGKNYSSLQQINRFSLCMFYTADMEGVYYIEDLDAFVVLDEEDSTLIVQDIFANKSVELEKVLSKLDSKYDSVRLGFTPNNADKNLFNVETYDGADDYRLYYLGDTLLEIERNNLYFPELSHA